MNWSLVCWVSVDVLSVGPGFSSVIAFLIVCLMQPSASDAAEVAACTHS